VAAGGHDLVEQIDIGGPTLVRAAAKNSPPVLVLTDPSQYAGVIAELLRGGTVSAATAQACAARAWDRVLEYDAAIAREFGGRGGTGKAGSKELRYGENPHQKARLEFDPDGPVVWDGDLTATELSYNNILDFSSAYALASDLADIAKFEGGGTGVVIVKHNNPCGVAWLPKGQSQLRALELAWEGGPVSAFGGVLAFTDPITDETAKYLAERFVELIGAPDLGADSPAMRVITAKRKNLKAVGVRRYGELPREGVASVPGGRLVQTADIGVDDPLNSVTKQEFPQDKRGLARFGIAVCRALKSNAIALVRKLPDGGYQLVGAGQGQPNRVEALEKLAIPRAIGVMGGATGLRDCIMISDAFFPFRDTVDMAAKAGIRFIVQPGGSIKDKESVAACDEHGVAMALTGIRHFRH
jgi:phosphoribosylaminoimidazolecarboxamide formyltransferase/IMP cyclohydrolase